MLKQLPFLFLLILSLAFLKVQAGSDSLDPTIVSQLNQDWLYYNQQYKTFFPYLKENREDRVNSISQLVDLNRYQSYNLNFIASPGLSLFIDQKLVYRNTSDTIEYTKIKIGEITHKADTDKELITFYHPEGNLPVHDFYIGNAAVATISLEVTQSASIAFSRNIGSRQNMFVVIFLSMLALFAIIKNRYPKKFYEFTRFDTIIPSMDEDMVWDLSSVPVLLFVFINSLCSALILFLIQEEFNLDTLHFLNVFSGNPVLGILTVSGGFFLVYIMKYIYLNIAGWIFNLSGLVKIQFFELMKVSLKINLFLTVLTMISYCSSYFHVGLSFDYFFYFTIISLLIVLMRVGYLSFKLSGFRNIYLFSYLCTTEILPLAIIVKMILF